MRNPIRTSTAIKSLANYLPETESSKGASSYAPDREIRRRKIHSVREELDRLSNSAKSSDATFFEFQKILNDMQDIGAEPPDDLVSDIKSNLFER